MPIAVRKKSVYKDISSKLAVKSAIGKTAFALSIIAVFSKIAGFAEKLIIAHFWGTGKKADVYFASMGVILSIVFFIKELIYPSVLPVFAQILKKTFYASCNLYKKLFVRLLAGLCVFAIIVILFPDAVTSIIVPGFSEEKKNLTSLLLRSLMPACVFMSLMTFTQSILNCRKDFIKAAGTQAGFKLFIATGLAMLIPTLDIYALAVIAITGSALAFTVQFVLIPESRALLSYQLYNNKYNIDNEFNQILKLAGPVILGVVFSHISQIVDNMIASTLPTGQLSYISYAKKLVDAILLIGPIALVTVIYSQLSHLKAENRIRDFKTLFIKALRLIVFISIPVSIIMVMSSYLIIAVMFQRGNFAAESTAGTSHIFLIYAVGFIIFAVEALVVFTFYALSNTMLPVKAGIVTVLLDIVLAIVFVKFYGIYAIAWSLVLSKTIKVSFLLYAVNKDLGCVFDRKFTKFIFKTAVVNLFAAICFYYLKNQETDISIWHNLIFSLVVPFTGFTAMLIVFSKIFKIEELNMFLSIFLFKKTSYFKSREASYD